MKESILIVEDEVEIGNILKMELEHEGYQVKIKTMEEMVSKWPYQICLI